MLNFGETLESHLLLRQPKVWLIGGSGGHIGVVIFGELGPPEVHRSVKLFQFDSLGYLLCLSDSIHQRFPNDLVLNHTYDWYRFARASIQDGPHGLHSLQRRQHAVICASIPSSLNMAESRDPCIQTQSIRQQVLDFSGRDFVELLVMSSLGHDDDCFPLS